METNNWIPNLHPLLVHFPIAILFTAIAIEVSGMLLKKTQSYSFITDLLIWAGTLLSIITLASGLNAAGELALPGNLNGAIATHALTAKITVAFFCIYSVVRIIRYRYRYKLTAAVSICILILGCIGLLGVYKTGEKGAMLVYKYGIGVKGQFKK